MEKPFKLFKEVETKEGVVDRRDVARKVEDKNEED
jgi:hypothetical protein